MSHVLSIARKELRGYFNSAVALIFLATFLAVVLFTFFWVGKFFTRNIADVRPMFEWLPLLLIFLVGALSMRLWSEEQKVGTIEILLTLPVPHWQLVLGKFLAGMALVALALVLTLGLPITVALMGDLDGGPVMGGYLAALLLAGAYLSIGLCVSAVTDNQIVSLIVTVVLCAALYLPGADAVAGFFGADVADVLRRIGTGSRFESILRGVLDVRDLAYYGSLIAAFLTLNTVLLKAKGWGRGPRTQTRRWNQRLLVGLVAVNAVALNLWLAPVASARVDLTEHDEYSLSDATEKVLGSLDQPLVIRGYFTEATHPLLAPLVPQIKDVLAEYKVLGGDKVRVEIVDPSTSEDVEREAQEKFGIKSFPISFADRRQQSVVNVYFHVLLQYGDQFEVLTNELIAVKQVGMGEPEVSLGNIEYQVTRTVKKLAYGFQSLDALFGALDGKVELTAYITPSTLPDGVKTAPDLLKKVVTELQAEAGGKLTFRQEEPSSREARQDLYRRFQFEPYRVSLMGREVFYLHFVLKVGKREIPLPLPEGGDLTEAALKQMVVEGLKRAAPGFIKTVALWTPPPERALPQGAPGRPPQQERPPQNFNALREQLAASYEVVPADLSSGRVTDDAEVLLLAGPNNLGDKEVRAVDQFLMRGGAVIVLDGRYRLNLTRRSLDIDPVVTGLEKALAMWGVTVPERLVLDEQNEAFPMPVQRDLGNGIVAQDVRKLPYPFFVRVPGTAMSDNIMTSALNAAVFHYASPVQVRAKLQPPPPGFQTPPESDGKPAPRRVHVLMKSSEDSWLQKAPNVQPDFTIFPDTGFGRPKEVPAGDDGPQALAVAITGGFPSVYAYDRTPRPDPTKPDAAAEADDDSRLLRRSSPDARLVVVGSSSFVTDELLQIYQEVGAEHVLNNFALVQNMVDWAVADTDLLTIRSRGNHTRLLDVDPDAAGRWEWLNYGIVVLGLGIVVGINALRRRTLVPIELDARTGAAGGVPPEKPAKDSDDEPTGKEVQP